MSNPKNSNISRTAQMVCLLRALSFYEVNEEYHSIDYVSPIFLLPLFRFVAKNKLLSKLLKKILPHNGIYEYIIARTKIIDEIFKKNIGCIDGVLVLGAGFDSRSIRFKKELKSVPVFEFDSAQTQASKIKMLASAKIELPRNLHLIPIDLDQDILKQKFIENNIQKGKRYLVVLEGLTMFLDKNSIDNIFSTISQYCGKESVLIFDYLYASILEGGNSQGEDVVKTVSKIGEKYKYGIRKESIQQFVSEHQFNLVEQWDKSKIKKLIFSNSKVSPIDLYSIVIAKKS